MDMNRYLIVVFCVLTGCAATVPMVNGQEMPVDHHLFAEWYADHIQNLDESYSSTILAHVEHDQLAGKYSPNVDEVSLLDNLPKFPVTKQLIPSESIPISQILQCFPILSEVVFSAIPEGDFHIRAPVLA